MTADTKLRTLNDQLESETADSERSAAEDSERYNGGDWWQLTDEEIRNLKLRTNFNVRIH
jgi:hypothetical protein